MSRVRAEPAGTLVLDNEGLRKAAHRTRDVIEWLAVARARDLRVITSAAIVVEVTQPGISRPALNWALSGLTVEEVTEPIARQASAMLAEAGLYGHKYAIDAMLCATALEAIAPVTVLTSDPNDISTLCGPGVTVIRI